MHGLIDYSLEIYTPSFFLKKKNRMENLESKSMPRTEWKRCYRLLVHHELIDKIEDHVQLRYYRLAS
jgi:hypothetical protein